MRPKKTRWIKCSPSEQIFKPQGTQGLNSAIILTLDEFEAVRLLDYTGLSQVKAAQEMHVHRSTVSRIITCARQKIARVLVEMLPLKIEGGCCKVIKGG